MKRLRLHGSMSDCLDNDRHTEFIAVNSIAYHYLSFLSPATLLPSSPEIDDSRGVINEKCSASLRPNAEPCVSVMTDMFHLVGGGGDQYAEEMFQKGETGIDFLFFIPSSCLEFSACAVFKPQLSHFRYYNIP